MNYLNVGRNTAGKAIRALLLLTMLAVSFAFLNEGSASASNAGYTVGSSFIMGWWTGVGISNLARIDTQKAAGQTFQTAYYTSDKPSYTNYLNKLKATNTYAFLQVDPAAAKAGNTAALVSFVNTYKSNPNVAGWLLFDEPEYNATGSAVLIKDYKAIKAADPNHPVAIIFAEGWCTYIANSIDKNYFSAADVIMFDSYPIFGQAEFGNWSNNHYKFSDYALTVNDCMTYLNGTKKFIMTAQGFKWDASSRNPTYNEERYWTFMTYVRGAAGLQYWIDYRADAAMTATITLVSTEASALSGVLQTGKYKDPAVSVNNTGISYKYGTSGGSTYLIAENDTANTISAKFTLPSGVNPANVTLVYDAYNTSTKLYKARTVATTKDSSGKSTFTDSFTKYQVHVYLIAGTAPAKSAAALANPAPTATVAAPQFQPPTKTAK